MMGSWTLTEELTGTSRQPDPELLNIEKIDHGRGTVVHGIGGQVFFFGLSNGLITQERIGNGIKRKFCGQFNFCLFHHCLQDLNLGPSKCKAQMLTITLACTISQYWVIHK